MDDPTNRRPDGRFGPGNNANPNGRNRALPEWFVASGEPALRHLMAVAAGTEEDSKVSRAECCWRVVERIWGKPKMSEEDHTQIASSVTAVLMALAVHDEK